MWTRWRGLLFVSSVFLITSGSSLCAALWRVCYIPLREREPERAGERKLARDVPKKSKREDRGAEF